MSDETQPHVSAGLPPDRAVVSDNLSDPHDLNRYLRLAYEAREASRYSIGRMDYGNKIGHVAAAHALAAFDRHKAHDQAGAREGFEKAVQLAPGFAAVYRLWAIAEFADGHQDRVDELMLKATTLAPDDASLWFHWGNMDRKRGCLADAQSRLLKALELSPDDAQILLALGMVEKVRDRFEQAAELLLRALENVPQGGSPERNKMICSTALASTYVQWAEKMERDRQLDRYETAFGECRDTPRILTTGKSVASRVSTLFRRRLSRKLEVARESLAALLKQKP